LNFGVLQYEKETDLTSIQIQRKSHIG